MNSVALCSEANESSLGPIKVILRSNDVEQVIDSIELTKLTISSHFESFFTQL